MLSNICRRYSVWFQGGALVLLGLLTFWPSLTFDFVNWDDPAYVEHNELIKGWSLGNLKGICTDVVTRNYAPLTIFTFLIDHSIWGMNPGGYHATNVLLHLVNGVLVFLLLRRLTGNMFVAWLSAGLFLIHPVQIESVVWISSRKGLLSSLFMLWALLVRLRPEPDGKHDLWYIALLFAALMAKAHAVVLPPIVLLYDVLVRRQSPAISLPRQVIPGLQALIVLMLTMGAQNTVLGGVRQHMNLSLPHIVVVDVTILWQYIRMLFWPTGLCVMYDPPTSGIWTQVLAGSIAWAAVVYGLWQIRNTHRLWILGACSFLLLLFPMLNFFRITTLMNDRYLYLPCIIVFAMFTSVVHRVVGIAGLHAGTVLRIVTAAVKSGFAVTILVVCLLLTTSHAPVWRDSRSLWTHALTEYPDMAVLRIQMAHTLYDSGDVREAIRVMSLALVECRADELDRERMLRILEEWRAANLPPQQATERPTFRQSKFNDLVEN